MRHIVTRQYAAKNGMVIDWSVGLSCEKRINKGDYKSRLICFMLYALLEIGYLTQIK